MKSLFLLLAFLLALPNPAQAMGKKKKDPQKLCGDFEGVVRIPEIPVSVTDPEGKPVTPPAYATVWVYDGDHSTLSVPDPVPLILPFAYNKFKAIPMPLRLNSEGTGYLIGPMDLELKKKLAGFLATSGTCKSWIWRMTLKVNPLPWSCDVKNCGKRDNADDRDFFIGPNGPRGYAGVPAVIPAGEEKFRPDLASTEIELMHDASEFGSTYEEYLKKTTKVVANAKAKLDELAARGAEGKLKANETLSGKALWTEVEIDFVPGLELPENQGFYTLGSWVSGLDLYDRCIRHAALAGRDVTVYGRTDRKWPVASRNGYDPGRFILSGIDRETWGFCQDKLKRNTDPYWPDVVAQIPGLTVFQRLKYSRARGENPRRMNVSGIFPLKLMPNPFEADEARGVAVETDLGWEPIVAGAEWLKDDMDCLIEKARDGQTAEIAAFRAVDKATGQTYLKLGQLESRCLKRR